MYNTPRGLASGRVMYKVVFVTDFVSVSFSFSLSYQRLPAIHDINSLLQS